MHGGVPPEHRSPSGGGGARGAGGRSHGGRLPTSRPHLPREKLKHTGRRRRTVRAMHKLASLSAELKSKVQDAGSALSDVRSRVTQQVIDAAGGGAAEEDEIPELQQHVRRTTAHTKQSRFCRPRGTSSCGQRLVHSHSRVASHPRTRISRHRLGSTRHSAGCTSGATSTCARSTRRPWP